MAGPTETASAATIARATRHWPFSAAHTVIALSSGLVLVILAVFALLCWQAYGTTLDTAKSRVERSSDILATEIEWIISSGLALLNQTAEDAAGPAALADLADTAHLAAISVLPAEVGFNIYDNAGNLVAEGGEVLLGSSIADEPFFQRLAAGEDWTISPQLKDATTNEAVFAIGKRLVANGQLIGVATLSFDAALLTNLWQPLELGPMSSVSLVRKDGWIVARYPALPETMDLSTTPAYATLNAAPSGSYQAFSAADGVARIVGFQHLPDMQLIVLAAVSQEAVFSQLWSSIVIVLWLIGPIAAALFVGALITARVLRRSELTQRRLSAAVAHNEVLFREIHHRVKNNLQSVASLLQMQPIPRDIKTNMGQRIAAMSAVHEHIYRSNNFSDVQVKGYLQTLIANIRAGHDPKVAVAEELDDLRVDKDAAAPLGLILNEVVANAFKHAFGDGREGTVTVRLTRLEDNRGQLVVEDNGTGFDPDAPSKGIGRRLIAALTQQINGESRFARAESGGSRFELIFPLASV